MFPRYVDIIVSFQKYFNFSFQMIPRSFSLHYIYIKAYNLQNWVILCARKSPCKLNLTKASKPIYEVSHAWFDIHLDLVCNNFYEHNLTSLLLLQFYWHCKQPVLELVLIFELKTNRCLWFVKYNQLLIINTKRVISWIFNLSLPTCVTMCFFFIKQIAEKINATI